MEKSKILEIIENANGCPVAVFCDNAKIFYVNMDGNYLLEDGDGFVAIRKNILGSSSNVANQEYAPWEFVYFSVGEVQFVTMYPSREVLAKVITNYTTPLGADKDKNLPEVVLKSSIMKSGIPRTFREDDKAPNKLEAGGYNGSTVYLDKDVPAYVKDEIENGSKG